MKKLASGQESILDFDKYPTKKGKFITSFGDHFIVFIKNSGDHSRDYDWAKAARLFRKKNYNLFKIDGILYQENKEKHNIYERRYLKGIPI